MDREQRHDRQQQADEVLALQAIYGDDCGFDAATRNVSVGPANRQKSLSLEIPSTFWGPKQFTYRRDQKACPLKTIFIRSKLPESAS